MLDCVGQPNSHQISKKKKKHDLVATRLFYVEFQMTQWLLGLQARKKRKKTQSNAHQIVLHNPTLDNLVPTKSFDVEFQMTKWLPSFQARKKT
jgi:hypothetical protein